MFVGKSSQDAASVSMTLNPETNFVSQKFHIVHDDDFQTMVLNAINLRPNQHEVFDVNNYSNDEKLVVPFQASIPGNQNKHTKVSLKFNETGYSNNNNENDKEEVTSLVHIVSEGSPLPTV